jgi:putative endonuclease
MALRAPVNWYFYVVRCFDTSLYAGIATDVARRVKQHNHGRGAKCLRSHKKLPVKLVYYERHPDKSSALKCEYAFKQLSRKEKLRVVRIGHRA